MSEYTLAKEVVELEEKLRWYKAFYDKMVKKYGDAMVEQYEEDDQEADMMKCPKCNSDYVEILPDGSCTCKACGYKY